MLPVVVARLAASVVELASDATDLVCRLTGCLGAAPVFAGLWQVAARQLLINVGKLV
jgi:hypothetical protein